MYFLWQKTNNKMFIYRKEYLYKETKALKIRYKQSYKKIRLYYLYVLRITIAGKMNRLISLME